MDARRRRDADQTTHPYDQTEHRSRSHEDQTRAQPPVDQVSDHNGYNHLHHDGRYLGDPSHRRGQRRLTLRGGSHDGDMTGGQRNAANLSGDAKHVNEPARAAASHLYGRNT